MNFAMIVYNIANKENIVKLPNEIELCDSLETLVNAFDDYVKNDIYSIGSVEEGKISIIRDAEYIILFKQNGEQYVIESDSDCEFIFGRFYYEVMYLNSFLCKLNKYENVFEEKFTNEEIMDFLGY